MFFCKYFVRRGEATLCNGQAVRPSGRAEHGQSSTRRMVRYSAAQSTMNDLQQGRAGRRECGLTGVKRGGGPPPNSLTPVKPRRAGTPQKEQYPHALKIVYKSNLKTVMHAFTPLKRSNALPYGVIAVLDVQNNASVTTLAASIVFTKLYIQVFAHDRSSK